MSFRFSQNIIIRVNLLIGLLLYSWISSAQTLYELIDSLEYQLTKLPDNEEKVTVYSDLCWYNNSVDAQKAIQYGEKALELSKELGYEVGEAQALNDIGIIYQYQSEFDKAIDYYKQSLSIRKKFNDSAQLGGSYLKIGIAFQSMGDYDSAIIYQLRALDYYYPINDLKGISYAENNIGILYHNQKLYDKAIEFHKKSLKTKEEINDISGIGGSYINIGNVYFEEKEMDSAYAYFKKGVKILKTVHDPVMLSNAYHNIGSCFIYDEQEDSALYYLEIAKDIREEIGDKKGLASTLLALGDLYLKNEDYAKAKEYLAACEPYVYQAQSKNELARFYGNLSKVYAYENEYLKAYEALLNYSAYHDSTMSESNATLLADMETKYQAEKKQQEIELLEKDKLAKDKAIRQNNIIITIGIFALIIAFLFILFIINANRKKRKVNQLLQSQNEEITKQKHVIEESHLEISDSIKYAQRLQQAILPPVDDLNTHLGDGFVLFLPKHIVSGDFYWMQPVSDGVCFAAADCTGHGVPGAMVSVVCSNALNRSVKEFGLTTTSDIINKTRELVIETFARSGKSVKDGMDIALCKIYKEGESVQLYYTGANNPLWIIKDSSRLSEEEKEHRGTIIEGEKALVEIKADKQPVGLSDHSSAFTEHMIPLSKGDTIYIFSDGYADQFGGPKSKKLMYKPFKKLLLEHVSSSMDDQKEILKSFINEWRGDNEQVDDICIIGVRV